MALGEYLGAGSGATKGLYHLNWNANDSSGNANNGSWTNITWTWGKIGSGAASLNGSSSKISVVVPATGDKTMSVWFNGNAVNADKRVWACRNSWADKPITSIGTNTSSKFFFQLRWDGSSGATVDAIWATTLSNWVWYNVVATLSWTAMSLYVNGKLDSSNTYSQGTITLNTSNLGSDSRDSTFINWIVDEAIYENRAWSASEVRKYYTYSKGRFWII